MNTVGLDHALSSEDEHPAPDELVDSREEEPGAAGIGGAPGPSRLALADPVPAFRTDLELRRGSSAGLFEVTDPATGRHFTLYEFELSIARMLDGRRHASDVIENGARLGIPVDLDGLQKFVRQLWRYGFLAPPGAQPAEQAEAEGGWPERAKWDEATRTLFQTGLRLARQGRSRDARSYLEAVLDADPGNAEAKELLAAIDEGSPLAATPIGSRDGVEARRSPARGRRIGTAIALAALVVAASGVLLSLRRREPQPPPVPVAPPPASVVPAAAGPLWRTAAVQRRAHPRRAEIAAASAGIVLWKKADGAPVEEGERVGVLRVVEEARVAGPIDPAAAARIRELELLAKQDPVYRDFLEKERRAAQRARSGRRVRELPLSAPAAGVLSLAVPDRATVESGASLAAIGDGAAWRIEAFVDGEPPAPDAACELRGDAASERTGCRLDGVSPRDGGAEIALEIEAARAPWMEGSRSLRVRVAPPGTPPDGAWQPGKGGP